MLNSSLSGMVAVFDPESGMWMLCRGTVHDLVVERSAGILRDQGPPRVVSYPRKLHLEMKLTREQYVTAEWMRDRGWQAPDEHVEIDPARGELPVGRAELEAGRGGDADGS